MLPLLRRQHRCIQAHNVFAELPLCNERCESTTPVTSPGHSNCFHAEKVFLQWKTSTFPQLSAQLVIFARGCDAEVFALRCQTCTVTIMQPLMSISLSIMRTMKSTESSNKKMRGRDGRRCSRGGLKEGKSTSVLWRPHHRRYLISASFPHCMAPRVVTILVQSILGASLEQQVVLLHRCLQSGSQSDQEDV